MRAPSVPTSMPRAFRWLWLALALALVLRTSVRDRGVITDHIEFGQRLLTGADLYAPYLEAKPLHPPYPPSFGLLTAPFSLVPERVARVGWGVLQVAALLIVVAWLRRQARAGGRLSPARIECVLLCAAALASRFILRDTHGGGGNLINLALVLWGFERSAGGRERLGGAVFGLSLATKPTAVMLWPLLWAFGQRRAAASALVSLAACVLASLALLRFDFACWQRWLEGTWRYATQADVFAVPELGFPPFTWMNQCLRCALARLVGDVPPEFATQVAGFVPGFGQPAHVVVVVRTLASVVLVLLTLVTIARLRHRPASRPAMIAATLALSLLLSPISWKAHHVALLPCFALLFARAFAGVRAGWFAASLYALACVLGEEITGKVLKEQLQSSYLVTLGTLAFWAASLRWARNSCSATARISRPAGCPRSSAR